MKKDQKQVIVAMSGGVDSSVTAAILQEEGYDVSGIIMLLWSEEKSDVVESARHVADLLRIPLFVKDFRELFKTGVIDYFVRTYEQGLTPNPCVVCNKVIKFGLLLQEAEKRGANYLATGHYVRLEKDENGIRLLKGLDNVKDQSYFLYKLNQKQLSHILFPLGGIDKSTVRKMAETYGLPVAHKKESQDLCFIENGNYREFLARLSKKKGIKGPIKNIAGQIVGTHSGLQNYTVGQRRGLGVAAGKPIYVVGLDVKNNTLIVGNNEQRAKNEFHIDDVNYISGTIPTGAINVSVKIRYTAKEIEATLTPISVDKAHITIKTSLLDITPGQSAVFYQGDELIGGGTIQK